MLSRGFAKEGRKAARSDNNLLQTVSVGLQRCGVPYYKLPGYIPDSAPTRSIHWKDCILNLFFKRPADYSASPLTNGRVKKNSDPLPCSLSTQMRPLCLSTISFVINRPIPSPDIWEAILSTRKNRENIFII